MVEWKGRLEGDVGRKARNLDQIESLPVPNFFVLTPGELKSIFGSVNSPEEILNSDIDGEKLEKIKDAYKDIGMSSEVRNANGKAKNLVGGQRNNQLVSLRVSNPGSYEYRLNVGSSDLIDSIKEVAASYFGEEKSFPSIIVQKMVEPDYSGAVMTGSMEQPDLMEVVEGLGTSLEEGENIPYLYVRESNSIHSRNPSEHFRVSRNPINGRKREKDVQPELPFQESEVRELLEKLGPENLNVKFAYKRGDFHVVDAWEEDPEYEVLKDSEIQGLKVSEGKINGEVGREIIYTDTTLPPEKYENALVARKGGYTSRDGEKARQKGKPAVFGFTHELRNGQRINMQEPGEGESSRFDSSPQGRSPPAGNVKDRDSTVASEVLTLNPREGRGVYTSPPYGRGYALTDRDAGDHQIPREGYIDSYQKAFEFDGDSAVLDTRKISGRAVEEVMEYLDADLKILIAERPEIEVLEKAVETGFDVFAADNRYIDGLRNELARAEKKFMIRKMRDLD